MSYTDDQLPSGLDAITSTDATDVFVVGDATDSNRAKKITKANLVTDLESSLNHDNLTGFVANEHIDHSAVSITPNTGLIGGGDLTASRTISMDISTLTDTASPVATDEIAIDTAAGMRKSDLLAAVNAAGAVMNSDTSTVDMSFVVDEDDMVSDSATKVPTQQSVKAYVDSITAVEKLDVTTTDATVSSTGVETTFYTIAVPAGSLGTNGCVKGEFFFDISTATTTTKTIRIKYGSTTLVGIAQGKTGTTLTTIQGVVNFALYAAGSTSAQEAYMSVAVQDYAEQNTNTFAAAVGSSSENSASALNITFSITQNSSDTFVMRNANASIM